MNVADYMEPFPQNGIQDDCYSLSFHSKRLEFHGSDECMDFQPSVTPLDSLEWIVTDERSLQEILALDLESNWFGEPGRRFLYDTVSEEDFHHNLREVYEKERYERPPSLPRHQCPDFLSHAREINGHLGGGGVGSGSAFETLPMDLDSVPPDEEARLQSETGATELNKNIVSSKHYAAAHCEVKSETEADTDVASLGQASEVDDLSDVPTTHKSRTCSVCREEFERAGDLARHKRDTGHKPFACTYPRCTATFTRHDALTRHRESHPGVSTALYPCQACDKYRGPTAFKRRDHLMQHMKKAHGQSVDALKPKFCPYDTCMYSGRDDPNGKFWGFVNRATHARHMRDSHGEGTLECNESGCDRKGRKGFARKRDLDIHREKVHTTS